jgi:glycine cleavage system H protein
MFVEFPEDLRYTKEHEWVRLEGTRARVGITDFAQDALGDVVYVDLPEIGAVVQAGQPLGEVESTKSVSDLYAPVSAKVVAVNGDLEGNPQLVNSDPYGEGWLVDLQVQAGSLEDGLHGLLDADGYRAVVTE